MMGSVKAYANMSIGILLVIFMSACDSQSVAEQDQNSINIDAEVSFATERDTYRAGDEVQIRLTNGSRSELGYNICYTFVDMEANVDDDWRSLQPGPGPDPDSAVACTLELRSLPPDESTESIVFLPIDVAPGVYRLTHDVEVNGTRYTVSTDTFKVERL